MMVDLDALVAVSLTVLVVAIYAVNLWWTLRALRRRGDERDLRDAAVAIALLLGAFGLAVADFAARALTAIQAAYALGVAVNAMRLVLFIVGLALLTRWRKQ